MTTIPTPMQIIAACDAGSDAIVALGLPRPKNYLEKIRIMWAAQDALSDHDRHALASRDSHELERVRSDHPKRGTGAYPVILKGGEIPFPQGAQ